MEQSCKFSMTDSIFKILTQIFDNSHSKKFKQDFNSKAGTFLVILPVVLNGFSCKSGSIEMRSGKNYLQS